jgi:hypothetical protein
MKIPSPAGLETCKVLSGDVAMWIHLYSTLFQEETLATALCSEVALAGQMSVLHFGSLHHQRYLYKKELYLGLFG